MGEIPEHNTFYQYLRSDESFFEQNRAGQFKNLVPPRHFERGDTWEVGISSISFPDSFYNIYGKMRRITIGNNCCELNYLIPAGRYTPQSMCEVLNKVAKLRLMPWKYDVAPGRSNKYEQPVMEEGERDFIPIKNDLGETNQAWLPFFSSEEEKARFQVLFDENELKESEWGYNTDVAEHGETHLIPPSEQMEEFQDLVKAFCTAARTGGVLDFRRINVNTANEEYAGHRPILRTINEFTLEDFSNFLAYHSRTLHQEQGGLNIMEFLQTSKLHFFYDHVYKKIGVRTVFENNPFGDYVIFHNDKLKNMLGMGKEDQSKLIDSGPNGYLARKGIKRLKYNANFEIIMENIFVYCNIIEESGIANYKVELAEILAVPPIDPTKKSTLSFNFSYPNFKAVKYSDVSTIEIHLADSLGKEIHFHDWGVTVVALKFRKSVSSSWWLEKIFNLINKMFNTVFNRK